MTDVVGAPCTLLRHVAATTHALEVVSHARATAAYSGSSTGNRLARIRATSLPR